MPDGWDYLFGEMERTIRKPLGLEKEEFDDFIDGGCRTHVRGDDFYIENTDATSGFVVFGFNEPADGYENRMQQEKARFQEQRLGIVREAIHHDENFGVFYWRRKAA